MLLCGTSNETSPDTGWQAGSDTYTPGGLYGTYAEVSGHLGRGPGRDAPHVARRCASPGWDKYPDEAYAEQQAEAN